MAYGLCEALQAKKAYWAERRSSPANRIASGPSSCPNPVSRCAGGRHPALGQEPGGSEITLEGYGAIVVGLAVIIYQPTPQTHDLGHCLFTTSRALKQAIMRMKSM